MVRKKIDNRLRVVIENGVKLGHRTLFAIVGAKGRDQVPVLHHMLTKCEVKTRPSVLWCYKKELGFTAHRKKHIKNLQRKIQTGKLNVNADDPFELFLSATKIRYCYYHETHKILGNSYGMAVLQDFEALTPNLLARTIETVEGGGLIILLLHSITSLKQLYTIAMDAHQRFRTESHQTIVHRFNERFLLSLTGCKRCVILDDELRILPISSHNLDVTPLADSKIVLETDISLMQLTQGLQDTQPVGCLIKLCKTLDQAKALLKFIEITSEKSLKCTVSVTASRGRGKSATLGLAVSAAIVFGYSNIYVTSPSPENLNTFFEFIFKGFDALDYQEHIDYSIIRTSNPECNKAVVKVDVFRDHRQTIQYIRPDESHTFHQAELLVIDEAAAIPLPIVKNMLGPYLTFLASTINGYEGTGRSLSLKLLNQLRMQASPVGNDMKNINNNEKGATTGRAFYEVTLEESVRYKPNDDIEIWLADLLCLNCTANAPTCFGCPAIDGCDLYYVNRDTLFSYHKASEEFLHKLMALYVASHYKNSPNDLLMMSDAPAHHLFCLLAPVDIVGRTIPEILVVIQICMEGGISKTSFNEHYSKGRSLSGDLIPWSIGLQYQDSEFPSLPGARIVRIATHPDYQGMGYGSRALYLLKKYYESKILMIDDNKSVGEDDMVDFNEHEDQSMEESIVPRKSLPPLLLKLSERVPEKLSYLGVSFGLTKQLLKFWKKADYIPVYIRQTTNDLTGEHSCIMLNIVNSNYASENNKWLLAYWTDFRKRFINLLAYQFRKFSPSLALGVLTSSTLNTAIKDVTKEELDVHLTKYDMKRLEMYSNNLVDYHLIMDLLPTLAKLYFSNLFGNTKISAVQAAILLGVGLQHKTIDDLTSELELPSNQLLGLFNRLIRRFVTYLNQILEYSMENLMISNEVPNIVPIAKDINIELEKTAKKLKIKQKKDLEELKSEGLMQFAIKGCEGEWNKLLSGKSKDHIISVKRNGVQLNTHTNNDDIDPKLIKKKKITK